MLIVALLLTVVTAVGGHRRWVPMLLWWVSLLLWGVLPLVGVIGTLLWHVPIAWRRHPVRDLAVVVRVPVPLP